jgi:hypothetical protein
MEYNQVEFEEGAEPVPFWDDAVYIMNDMTKAQKKEAIRYLKKKLKEKES